MIRVHIRFNPDRITGRIIQDYLLTRAQQAIAETFNTDQGPVTPDEVEVVCTPYTSLDRSDRDLVVSIAAFAFPDRIIARRDIRDRIMQFLHVVTETHHTFALFIDWNESDFAEYPDRTA